MNEGIGCCLSVIEDLEHGDDCRAIVGVGDTSSVVRLACRFSVVPQTDTETGKSHWHSEKEGPRKRDRREKGG
jgi:hypothetical protein